jgi:hypothetical protein
MWNVKAKVMPVLAGGLEPSHNHSNNILATYDEITQRFTQTSHIGHCTQTADSANGKVQNILHGRNNITCSAECKYRTAAALCKL